MMMPIEEAKKFVDKPFLTRSDIEALIDCSHTLSDRVIKEIREQIKQEGKMVMDGYYSTPRVLKILDLEYLIK